jgi:hypothetical protein
VTVWEAIAVFVLIPLALYVVLGLFTLREKFAGRARYRPGASWEYDPMWWTGEPNGIGRPTQPPSRPTGPTAKGGVRGSW